MKRTFVLLVVFMFLGGLTGVETNEEEILRNLREIRKEQTRQASSIQNLIVQLQSGTVRMDSLEARIRTNSQRLDSTKTTIMSNIESNRHQLEGEIRQSRTVVSERTRTFMLVLGGAFLAIALAIAFIRKKLIWQDKELYSSISETRKAFDEKSVILDNQLIELAAKQLDLYQRYHPDTKGNKEPDHSLVLKIADEITRIQQNLNHMDPSIKGHKQLSRATNAILDNLNANGYEIPPLLGVSFDDNYNMIATMEMDENLEPGTKKIKRVVKPMVKYNGVMIQAAEVYVAFN
jgi:hypothetical protein